MEIRSENYIRFSPLVTKHFIPLYAALGHLMI